MFILEHNFTKVGSLQKPNYKREVYSFLSKDLPLINYFKKASINKPLGKCEVKLLWNLFLILS